MMVSVAMLAIMALAGWFAMYYVPRRKRLIEERVRAARQAAAEKAVAEKAAAEKAAAESAA
ncbi:MAG: hypothetical protein WAV07_19975, partial [Candidatus Contendobacter sp.]